MGLVAIRLNFSVTLWKMGPGCRFFEGYGAGVTGQEFSSKINDELTLFACNSGLQALQKCQPKTCPASPFVPRATRVAPQPIGNHPTEVTRSDRLYSRGDVAFLDFR
jgi:hypothetical protein